MKKLLAAVSSLALILLGSSAFAVVPSATMQFPTTGWGGYAPGNIQCGEALGANMNSTADQPIYISAPSSLYEVSEIAATNASVSLTTAAGGVYTAAGKTGTQVVGSAQAYSTLTAAATNAAGSYLILTLNAPTAVYNSSVLYLSLTTAQGAAATADFRVYCHPLYR